MHLFKPSTVLLLSGGAALALFGQAARRARAPAPPPPTQRCQALSDICVDNQKEGSLEVILPPKAQRTGFTLLAREDDRESLENMRG